MLANPCVENLTSLNAIGFIIDWMGATSNYNFTLEDKFYKVIEPDFNLTGRYYAALAKTAIENNHSKNSMDLQLKAITRCLEYCELTKNNVKITKKLQKYIDAKNASNLKELIVIPK